MPETLNVTNELSKRKTKTFFKHYGPVRPAKLC